MDGNLSITVTATAGDVVVACSGEVDVASAPELDEQLTALVDGGTTGLTVDLRQVSFLDSTGIGVLVGAEKRCREEGGEIRLVVSTDRLRRLFEITGLTGIFDIVDDLEPRG